MDSSGSLPGLGGSLAVSLVSLGVVCLLAYVALKLLSRRGVGRPNGPIKVLARCPLEPHRASSSCHRGTGERMLRARRGVPPETR